MAGNEGFEKARGEALRGLRKATEKEPRVATSSARKKEKGKVWYNYLTLTFRNSMPVIGGNFNLQSLVNYISSLWNCQGDYIL